MKTVTTAMVMTAALLLVPTAQAAPDVKDLIGTWEIVKSDGDAPKGATIEFLKEGKLKVTVEVEGKKESVDGTYKLDGEKLEVKIGKDEAETVTVKELTKDKLVVVDKDKKTTELKKK